MNLILDEFAPMPVGLAELNLACLGRGLPDPEVTELEGCLFAESHRPVLPKHHAHAAEKRFLALEGLHALSIMADFLFAKIAAHNTLIMDPGDWTDVEYEIHQACEETEDSLSIINRFPADRNLPELDIE